LKRTKDSQLLVVAMTTIEGARISPKDTQLLIVEFASELRWTFKSLTE
jgi:hypothetical protein